MPRRRQTVYEVAFDNLAGSARLATRYRVDAARSAAQAMLRAAATSAPALARASARDLLHALAWTRGYTGRKAEAGVQVGTLGRLTIHKSQLKLTGDLND